MTTEQPTVYRLARLAGLAVDPDSPDSLAARFLATVAETTAECMAEPDSTPDDAARLAVADVEAMATADQWLIFAELHLWNDDDAADAACWHMAHDGELSTLALAAVAELAERLAHRLARAEPEHQDDDA